LPALAQTIGPRSPAAASASISTEAPRPLKLRIGFAVSTLIVSRQPSDCDSGSQSY
jgi:hypothetical protein